MTALKAIFWGLAKLGQDKDPLFWPNIRNPPNWGYGPSFCENVNIFTEWRPVAPIFPALQIAGRKPHKILARPAKILWPRHTRLFRQKCRRHFFARPKNLREQILGRETLASGFFQKIQNFLKIQKFLISQKMAPFSLKVTPKMRPKKFLKFSEILAQKSPFLAIFEPFSQTPPKNDIKCRHGSHLRSQKGAQMRPMTKKKNDSFSFSSWVSSELPFETLDKTHDEN